MSDEEPGVRLASIHIYPMKAARAVDLGKSLVEPWGLAGDRRWLLVDADGRFVSQREEPSLARVVVTHGPLAQAISVSADGSPSRQVELGRWLTEDGGQPVPMTRFRPNAVVTGALPWAEDHWRRIRIGAVEFRVVKPCGRCVVTTTDQITGEVGSQPLKMLGRRRRFSKQLVFGQNMIPDSPGVIRAGDQVEVLETA